MSQWPGDHPIGKAHSAVLCRADTDPSRKICLGTILAVPGTVVACVHVWSSPSHSCATEVLLSDVTTMSTSCHWCAICSPNPTTPSWIVIILHGTWCAPKAAQQQYHQGATTGRMQQQRQSVLFGGGLVWWTCICSTSRHTRVSCIGQPKLIGDNPRRAAKAFGSSSNWCGNSPAEGAGSVTTSP